MSASPLSLQQERTDLAWRRTGLAAVGLALAGLRLAAEQGAAGIAAGLSATLAALGVAGLARWRSHELLRVGVPQPMSPRAGRSFAGLLLVLHLAGLLLVVTA